MKGEPILIRCEGSGGTGNVVKTTAGTAFSLHPYTADGMTVRMCAMCGGMFAGYLTVPDHDRDDILKRIDRGDFDG